MLSRILFSNYLSKAYLKSDLPLLPESDTTRYLLVERLDITKTDLNIFKVRLVDRGSNSSKPVFEDFRSGEEFKLSISSYGKSWILLPED